MTKFTNLICKSKTYIALGIAFGIADAVQALQPRQDGLHIGGAQSRPVHAVALHDGDTAPCALPGDNGDARLA